MASTARASVDPDFVIAPVRRELFGSFVEHMGRCVYTGIYEPDHPTADEARFPRRRAELIRELGVTVVRYPGGNFVSNYVWENGVGPRADRPTTSIWPGAASRPTRSAPTISCQWCERLGVEPMITVNLGTRGLVEAVELLQYCNAEPGTQLADRRVEERAARAVRRSAVVPGQRDGRALADRSQDRRGVCPAGRRDRQGHAPLRRRPRLVACGSSNSAMPTFGDLGTRRARAVLRRRRPHLGCTPTTSRSTATSSPSWPAPTTWTASSARWWPPPTTSPRVTWLGQADHDQLRRVERLVPARASPARAALPIRRHARR